jgi:hypothetical protein
MFMRVPCIALIVLLLSSCGEDPTGVTAGETMSVAEQTAIEAALGRVADALETDGRTAQDTLMADLTRVSARLVSLQGRQGTLSVTGPAVGGTASMHGVALLASAQNAPTGSPVQFLVAWEGLDATAFTVTRAVVVMATGTSPFSLPSVSTSNAARLIRFDGADATDFYYNVTGTLTASVDRFGGNCPGITNTGGNSCEIGQQTVGGSVTGSNDNGATTSAYGWADTVVPAFRLALASFTL